MAVIPFSRISHLLILLLFLAITLTEEIPHCVCYWWFVALGRYSSLLSLWLGSVEPEMVSFHFAVCEIYQILFLWLGQATLSQKIYNYILTLIETRSRDTATEQSFIFYCAPVSNLWEMCIIELIPAIKFMRIEVGPVMSSIVNYETSKHILGASWFVLTFWGHFHEFLEIEFWRQEIPQLRQLVPRHLAVDVWILET